MPPSMQMRTFKISNICLCYPPYFIPCLLLFLSLFEMIALSRYKYFLNIYWAVLVVCNFFKGVRGIMGYLIFRGLLFT